MMPARFSVRLCRWYAPIVVTAFLLGANALVGRTGPTNTLTGAQSRRLTFQVGETVGRLTPRAGAQGAPDRLLRTILSDLPTNRRGRVSILFVGNSQTMAIMDMGPGDRIVAAWLASLLDHGGGDEPFAVRFASEANLTMSELLIKVVVAAADPSRRPDVVIAGIVLDGLRWVEARGELVKLADSPAFRAQMARLIKTVPVRPAAARAVATLLQPEPIEAEVALNPRAAGARSDRPITGVERRLQEWVEVTVPLFRARRDIHAELNLEYTALRNLAFGFTTTTRRPIAPALYATNLELIELTLRFLRGQGINAVFYVAPIRPLEPSPYLSDDVARFRRDLATLCQRYDASYLDYSRLIPERLWTNYPQSDRSGVGGQPDFAHFTGMAHKMLAEQLVGDVWPLLNSRLAQKR